MNAGCPREAVWQCSVSPIFKPGRVSTLLSVTTCLSLHLQVWTVWNGYEKSSLCRRGQTLLCKLAYLKRIAPPLVIFDQFSDVCLRGLRWKFMFSPRSPLLIRSAGNSRSGHRWRSGFFLQEVSNTVQGVMECPSAQLYRIRWQVIHSLPSKHFFS